MEIHVAGGADRQGDIQVRARARTGVDHAERPDPVRVVPGHLDGREVILTDKEFELAAFLFRNLGRLLSRGHLLEAVWGRNPDLATRTVDTHISRVRSKLNLRPENGFRLTPTYNFGYRLEKIDPAEVATVGTEVVSQG